MIMEIKYIEKNLCLKNKKDSDVVQENRKGEANGTYPR